MEKNIYKVALGQLFMIQIALEDGSQVWFEGGLKTLSSEHLNYDPLIWLKVTTLASTASVLRDDKIPLKFQESLQKLFFP